MYRPIVHYSLSYLIPSCPLVYTLSPHHHILPIPLIHHVSLAFTCYSILPYHTLPYHTLNYFTLPLLKLDQNISQNNYGYPKNFGYPKMYFRISTNRFLDIHNSFLDIQKYIKIHFWISKSQCILGYPKIHFWISKNPAEFRISIIRLLDIHNSILGYPKIGNISMY